MYIIVGVQMRKCAAGPKCKRVARMQRLNSDRSLSGYYPEELMTCFEPQCLDSLMRRAESGRLLSEEDLPSHTSNNAKALGPESKNRIAIRIYNFSVSGAHGMYSISSKQWA